MNRVAHDESLDVLGAARPVPADGPSKWPSVVAVARSDVLIMWMSDIAPGANWDRPFAPHRAIGRLVRRSDIWGIWSDNFNVAWRLTSPVSAQLSMIATGTTQLSFRTARSFVGCGIRRDESPTTSGT